MTPRGFFNLELILSYLGLFFILPVDTAIVVEIDLTELIRSCCMLLLIKLLHGRKNCMNMSMVCAARSQRSLGGKKEEEDGIFLEVKK